MEAPLINKVAQSSLKTINLENYYPKQDILSFDLKDYLFHGLILKEKDFRKALKEHDWSQYTDKTLLIFCSSDAIIPVWAYMLVASYVADFAHDIYQGSEEEYLKNHYAQTLDSIAYQSYQDERIVIKGCSDRPVPPIAYAILTAKLKPYAQSIMYGEPCSTVPIFKRPRVLK
jgi:hypothetical protein